MLLGVWELCVNTRLSPQGVTGNRNGKQIKTSPFIFTRPCNPFSLLLLCVSYSGKKLSGNCLPKVVFKSPKCHLYACLWTPCLLCEPVLFPKKAFLLISEVSVPFYSVCI